VGKSTHVPSGMLWQAHTAKTGTHYTKMTSGLRYTQMTSGVMKHHWHYKCRYIGLICSKPLNTMPGVPHNKDSKGTLHHHSSSPGNVPPLL
jgi:hypothetical protein